MVGDVILEVTAPVAGSPRHSVSVAAVVVDDHDRTLLIQRRDNGRWEPPGGVLELGEEIIDGLRREVAEETGLQVQPSALTGVYKNMTQGVVALVFRCRPAGDSPVAGDTATGGPVTGDTATGGPITGDTATGDPAISPAVAGSEIAAVRWASRQEVADLADPVFAVRVFDAIDYVMPPAVRAHDGVRLI
jgi:8-oxo-dGTP diphosphatase